VSPAQRFEGLLGAAFARLFKGQVEPVPDRPMVIDNQRHAPRARESRPLLFRYLVIGGLSIAIDVSLLFGLHSVVGVRLSIATTVAFVVSMVFNFTCNRFAMAAGDTEQLTRHAFRYGLLVVANLAVTVAVVTGADHIGVPYVVGKLAVVAASTCWNFVLYRRWVFAQPERRPA
jgi:putative flippase GtrA